MRRAYRMLLRLYPRKHRRQFEDEMLAVFTQTANDRRKQGWRAYTSFMFRECFGLLAGACKEMPALPGFAPYLGGILVAALLHAGFYAVTSRVLAAIAAGFQHPQAPTADAMTPELTLSLFGVASLFCLLPLFFILSARLMHRRR
jgi:hypothetical protein